MIEGLFTIVVAGGLTLGVYPHEGTYQDCERDAIHATVEGQRLRVLEGGAPNGARAYCLTGEPPELGELAPKPGLWL